MLEEREGKIFIRAFLKPEMAESETALQDRFFKNLLDMEVELNGPIATELYKKYGISIRVHL